MSNEKTITYRNNKLSKEERMNNLKESLHLFNQMCKVNKWELGTAKRKTASYVWAAAKKDEDIIYSTLFGRDIGIELQDFLNKQ